ncbi:hypothetical protein RCH09_001215 [Actimicrobium sp. GrIS 1.19]|uniref:hypothetical protein n=1 Tax=Actimicrobium sp. GrIS 1.19 TaxID=3071708 RepID=UPI002E06D6A9|nr:hypothetical protein [Actimicrobium sp. GrIS 1.19]
MSCKNIFNIVVVLMKNSNIIYQQFIGKTPGSNLCARPPANFLSLNHRKKIPYQRYLRSGFAPKHALFGDRRNREERVRGVCDMVSRAMHMPSSATRIAMRPVCAGLQKKQ